MKAIIIILLFFEINLKLLEKEKPKLFETISENNIQTDYINSIEYNPKKIKEIIDKYNFPEHYNCTEETEEEIHPKNQGKCNYSWSIASTTALSYRFHKKGIKVDLSPQYGVSCYFKNCSFENYLIDSQLNIIKNGTLEQDCLPFNSQDENISEKCPEKCKNGSELIKYYSHKPYSTEKYNSEINFYDIIILIIDELITNGPVVAQVDLFQD